MKCWAWTAVVSWEIKVLNHSPALSSGCSPAFPDLLPGSTASFPHFPHFLHRWNCPGVLAVVLVGTWGLQVWVAGVASPAVDAAGSAKALLSILCSSTGSTGGSQCPPWNAHLEHILNRTGPLELHVCLCVCVCISGGCNIAGNGFHLRIPRGAPAPSVNASGKH